MIYIIHKILVLIKDILKILKIIFSNAFLRSISIFRSIFFNYFFSQQIMMKNPRCQEKKIIKGIRNLFRQKK